MDQYHLQNKGDQWKLTKSGAERATIAFGDATKAEAKQAAANHLRARDEASSMMVHKKAGGFQTEHTYPRSADPRRSKG